MVAKVEWHHGERFPRDGFIVNNLSRPAERVIAFYNQRGTAEQYIKEGKNAINLDPAFLPWLPQQRGASSAARLGIQLGQLPAHSRLVRRSGPLVADHLTRQSDQAWSAGRAPQPGHHFPESGSGGLESTLLRTILRLIEGLRPAPLPVPLTGLDRDTFKSLDRTGVCCTGRCAPSQCLKRSRGRVSHR